MLAAMAQPAPKRSRVRDLLTKPIRLPQWFAERPSSNQPRIYGFNDERDLVVRQVADRVAEQCMAGDLELLLNDSARREIERLEKQRDDEAREWLGFWQTVARKLARMSEAERSRALREVVDATAADIAGNFDPRVYRFGLRTVPALITGVMNPKQLALDAINTNSVGADRLVTVTGHLDEMRALSRRGTIVVVPTHSSNLDSLAIGESLSREQLPPVVYGAGKNLFTNPIISFFMHNLGAYRIDRRIRSRIYKEVLKTYSSVMIERGYHSLFFPGGTRSRSGMIESHLKLGLAGTALSAYVRNAMVAKERGESPRPVFFVPVTINYALVLEAESLIDDYLKLEGQARYIIEDDEFSQIDRWLVFFRRLTSYGAACVLRYGPAIDPFGNRVDAEGRSLAPGGQVIDPVSYITHRGKVVLDAKRDSAYTRDLGRELVGHYRRETVIMTTQFVAHLLFRRLVSETPGVDLFGRVRRRGEITWDHADYVIDYLETRDRLRALAAAGGVHIDSCLETDSAERSLERAMDAWGGYHTKKTVRPRRSGLVALLSKPPRPLRRAARGHVADARGPGDRRARRGAVMAESSPSASESSPSEPRPLVAVLGGGRFGQALVRAAARTGEVLLWSRREPELELDTVRVTTELAEVAAAELILLAVPSRHAETLLAEVGAHLDGRHLLVHVSRGLVNDELGTMSQVLRSVTPCRRVGVLAGPLSVDVLSKASPGAGVVGSEFSEVVDAVRGAIGGPTLRIYGNEDLRGVELAAALTGLLLLSMGFAQRIGFGPATIGAVGTRGVAEARRIGLALGARAETFGGLACFGDLFAAAAGSDRPELELGRALAEGASPKAALLHAGGNIEGVEVARRVAEFGKRRGIRTPLADVIAEMVSGRVNPADGVLKLMARDVGRE